MLVGSLILLLLVAGLEFSKAPSYSLRRLPFECPTPNIVNGRVRIRFRSKVAKFQCHPGYELVGNKYATCSHGTWDEPAPVCVRPSDSCHIPQLENGMVLQQHRDSWLTFFCDPGYTLRGPNSIYCNGSGWNDTAPTCLAASSGASEPALACDFESSDLCGWRHDDFHDFDWRRFNKKTPSSFMNTGPKFDHTYGPGRDGYYMYIESTAKVTNSTARLLSPLYDSSIAKNGCFQFYYHMYGLSTGGLRVYEKPASVHQEYILNTYSYMIFDLWHNQGDFWHQAVVPLKDYNEDFQLIIEGIRGVSFTSDIAIDDVSILQGDNCTKALQDVAEPTSTVPPIDSCAGRCEKFPAADARFVAATSNSCGCGISCLIQMTCCPDYLDVCEFTKDSSDNSPDDDDDLNDSQKEKLVASTSDEPSTTTLKTTTAQTTTTTTTAAPTTIKTTIKIATTTAKTEKPTTATTETTTKATTKIMPKLTFLTTEKIHNANDNNVTATVKTVATTSKTTTTKMLETTTRKRESTTVKTAKVLTTMLIDDIVVEGPAVPIDKHLLNGVKTTKNVDEAKSKSKALITALVILATLVTLAAAAWTVALIWSSKGRHVMNRLRGRVYNDPEVRFLTRDTDN